MSFKPFRFAERWGIVTPTCDPPANAEPVLRSVNRFLTRSYAAGGSGMYLTSADSAAAVSR